MAEYGFVQKYQKTAEKNKTDMSTILSLVSTGEKDLS